MPIDVTVKSLDEIPEPLRDAFTKQEDGSFRLAAETTEEVGALRRALEAEKDARRKANDRARTIPEGFTPERWDALLELEDETRRGKLTAKQREEIETYRKEDAQRYGEKMQKLEATIARLTRNLEDRAIDAEATAAIAELKGAPHLLLDIVKKQVKMVEDGDQFHARVMDEHGLERVGTGGKPMTIRQLVEEMRQSDKYARAFDGSGASGSGAAGGSARGGTGARTVAADDESAFMANLKDIASGKVRVNVGE